MNKYKIIALIGEAGSGKDSVMREVIKRNSGLHEIISCTTRPPREGEINGINYFFLTNEEFAAKVINMEMFEATSFRGWFYGTSIDSLDKSVINIGVFNPDGIYALLESSNVELTVYYLKASPKERLIRQLTRERDPDIEEILRRYRTDNEDFYNLDFNYIELENNTPEDFYDCVGYICASLETA